MGDILNYHPFGFLLIHFHWFYPLQINRLKLLASYFTNSFLFDSSAMNSFLQHCRDLVTEDVIRRLLAPLKCALLMFTQYEQHVVVLYDSFF